MDYAVFSAGARDTAGHAGRICDDSKRRLGYDAVFRDIDATLQVRISSAHCRRPSRAARVSIVLIETPGWTCGRRMVDGAWTTLETTYAEVEMALAKPNRP